MYKILGNVCRIFLGESFPHKASQFGFCSCCGKRRLIDDYGNEIFVSRV